MQMIFVTDKKTYLKRQKEELLFPATFYSEKVFVRVYVYWLNRYSMQTKLDLQNWARKSAFEFFKDFDDPFFNITGNVDITDLFLHCKKTKESFFLSCLFCSAKVSNAIENFRMRQNGNEVIVYEKVHAGSAVFHKNNNTFSYCYFEYFDDRKTFLEKGQIELDAHLKNPQFDARHNENNLIYHSVIPWVHFTQFKHAKHKRANDSIPRVTFGKVAENSPGKFEIPVSVEVNHALCDGYHVGLFFEQFEKAASDF